MASKRSLLSSSTSNKYDEQEHRIELCQFGSNETDSSSNCIDKFREMVDLRPTKIKDPLLRKQIDDFKQKYLEKWLKDLNVLSFDEIEEPTISSSVEVEKKLHFTKNKVKSHSASKLEKKCRSRLRSNVKHNMELNEFKSTCQNFDVDMKIETKPIVEKKKKCKFMGTIWNVD